MEIITVTREQLYEEIWTRAVSKVCKKYNVTDAAVRKKCKQYNIPLPNNKYWALMQHGKPIPRIPLPAYEGNNKITFNCSPKNDIVLPKKPSDDFDYLPEEERKKVLSIYKNISLNYELKNCHKLIIDHKEAMIGLKRQKADLVHLYRGYDSFYYPIKRPEAIVDTSSVSENNFNRAYVILDTLIKSFEAVGCEMIIEKNMTYALVRNEKIRLRLREKYIKGEGKKLLGQH